jgi:hypothetical protein
LIPERYGNVAKPVEETAQTEEKPIDVEARRIAKELEPIIKAYLVGSLSGCGFLCNWV